MQKQFLNRSRFKLSPLSFCCCCLAHLAFYNCCVFTEGVGGNLVAVQASRISTYLHMSGLPMGEPSPSPRKCPTPCMAFFSSSKFLWTGATSKLKKCRFIFIFFLFSLVSAVNSRSARVLFLLVAPGHLVFLYTINSLRGGHTTLTPIFITFYLAAALLQVSTLKYRKSSRQSCLVEGLGLYSTTTGLYVL